MLVKVHQSSQSGGAVAMPSHLVQGLDVSGSPSFMVTLNWFLHLPHVYGTCIVVILDRKLWLWRYKNWRRIINIGIQKKGSNLGQPYHK